MASKITIRAAEAGDLPALTDIYNHFVINTHVTFDTEPFSPLDRQAWFDRYQDHGRHQLLVAVDEASGEILGYTTSGQLRPKQAYDTSVETTVRPEIRQVPGRHLDAEVSRLRQFTSGSESHR